ncbi:uncharacterized protein LOC144620381 isoform X1 [Crassostrea virginica]
MMSRSLIFVGCLLILFLISFVLQFCGTCSPYWIKDNNGTSDCFRGVVYNQGCPDGTEGLGDTILKLQITSFGILILVAIYCICFFSCARCIDDDDDEGSCVKSLNVAIFLYLVTGVLGLIGCILAFVNFEDNTKGWSLFVSLAAACIEIVNAILFCSGICYVRRGPTSSVGENIELFFSFTDIPCHVFQ